MPSKFYAMLAAVCLCAAIFLTEMVNRPGVNLLLVLGIGALAVFAVRFIIAFTVRFIIAAVLAELAERQEQEIKR